MNTFFEIIGVIAGLCVAIPSIPQIIQTIKTKDVKGLSTNMYYIWVIGGICRILYGYYLSSWQMELFNTISALCSFIMIILIKKYSKKGKK